MLIIDEAGMADTYDLQTLVTHAREKSAKVILVGDHYQLQPIGAGQAFRGIVDIIGSANLHTVYRQKEAWQKIATQELSAGNIEQALIAYDEHGNISWQRNKERAIIQLVHDYIDIVTATPEKSVIVMAYERSDVHTININIHDTLKQAGLLQEGQIYQTDFGKYEFSTGDRVMFGRNEYKEYDIRNGMTGRVIGQGSTGPIIKIDDSDRIINLDCSKYGSVKYGYAATIHKEQGVTADHALILASKYFDVHSSYVALSRHRDSVKLYIDQTTFADLPAFVRSIDRVSGKDLAGDFSDGKITDPGYINVQHYKEASAAAITKIKEINDWSDKKNEAVTRHPEWKSFRQLVETRNQAAKKIRRT